MDLRAAGFIFGVLGTIYACRAAEVYHREQEEKILQMEKQKQDQARRSQLQQQPHHYHHHQTKGSWFTSWFK